MKSIPAGLQTHYETGSTTLAILWRLTRTDGEVFGFTDHDQPVPYGGTTFRPTSAFDASALSTRSELNVDNLEIIGLLDDAGITAADIEAGLWDGASVRIVEVNWADTSLGENVLRVGEIGNIQRKPGQYIAELRGLMTHLQNNIGRLVVPACDADLGDARCGVDINGSPGLNYSGTVSAVTSRSEFHSTTAQVVAQESGYFDYGVVRWVTGMNAGLSMEIKQHAFTGSPGADADLTLQLAMPYAISPGDTFVLQPGCDKSKATCIAKFNNVVNFRGFSFVPGQDKVLLVGGQ